MDLVTVGWLALELTGSPFMVAIAAFARSAPLMIVGPLAGIVADRVSRGRLLVATQVASAAAAIALAGLFGTKVGGYRALVAVELLFGALWSFDLPARRTLLFTVLGASRVAQAVSLETVSMQIAKMTGPLVAGLLFARFGPPACYALMATVALVGAIVIGRNIVGGVDMAPGDDRTVRPADSDGPDAPRHGRRASRDSASIGGSVGSVVDTLAIGLRTAWETPIMRAALLITIAMNVLLFPYQHMLPVFARDVLAGGPTTLGALVAAEGVGALAGALMIAAYGGRLSHARLFAAGVLVTPAFLLLFAGSHWLALCLVLLVAIGLAESAFAAMQSTLVLLAAPAHARGGAMGILSACIGTQPVGTLAIGALAGTIGVSRTFALNALAALAVIIPLAVPLMRRRGA